MGRKPNLDLIPTCLGTHDPGDHLCDGNPEASGNDSIPCSFRERCIGFQHHLEDTGHDDEQYIELVPIKSKIVQEQTGWKRTAQPVGRTFAEFNKFCKGLARLYNVERLRRPVVRPKPQPKARGKRGRSAKKHGNKYSADKVRQATARRLIAHFCYTLREETKRKLSLDRRGGSLVLPGTFYAIDRRDKSGYISIYCRRIRRQSGGSGSHDAAVAALYPRYRSNTLDIRLAVDVRDLQQILKTEDTFSIDPEPVRDGAFRTVCKRLDTPKLTVLASGLARMIEQGILKLPAR